MLAELVDIAGTGLVMGVFYAMMAVGLSLIFGILKVVNFAHGEFFMIGAYAYTLIALRTGMSLGTALVTAVLVGAAVGVLTERLLLRPLYAGYVDWARIRHEYMIIVTFGLSLFLMNFVSQFIGPYSVKGPDLVARSRVEIGPIMMSGHRFAAFLIGSGFLAASLAALRFSFWGKQIQAVAQNRLGASLAGIDPARVSSIVFGLSGALAGLSGALLAPIFHAEPQVGVLPSVKSYVVVVLGGMGSVAGSVIGGLIVGILENFGAIYVSYAYRDVFGFIILMAVLLLRPHGLFGERARPV